MRTVILFGFACAIPLVPVAGAAMAAGLLRRRDRLAGLPPLAALIGFFFCGAVGWASVPAEWTTSFGGTWYAAINAAIVGAAFEDPAEGVMMYFFLPALLGAVAFALVAVVALWRIPVPAAAGHRLS